MKVLICHEPGSDIPSARYYGGDAEGNPMPGEDVDEVLRQAAEVHRRVHGHVTFIVEHPAPHRMHHDEVKAEIAKRRAS